MEEEAREGQFQCSSNPLTAVDSTLNPSGIGARMLFDKGGKYSCKQSWKGTMEKAEGNALTHSFPSKHRPYSNRVRPSCSRDVMFRTSL